MVDHINTKEKEIDNLVKEVLKAEEEKKRQERPGKGGLEPVQEEDVIAVDNAPAESAPPGDEEPKKKKRGNIFTRMVHALRKRFSGNRRSRA